MNTNGQATADAIQQLREQGMLTLVLPGGELDFAKGNTEALLKVLKGVGRSDLSLGRIYEGHINALLLIHLFAGEEQKEQWFADASNGCLFGVWNTGTADAIEITTSDDAFRLHGKKTFASGAGTVDRALITGNCTQGDRKSWQMCIVNTEDLPGNAIDYNSWHPMGMYGSTSYTVDFSGYEGSLLHLFGSGDAYYKQPYFSAGAIRFCAVQLGGAEALLNETVNYLKSLDRTGDANQLARVGEMSTAVASGQIWLQMAARHWEEWKDQPAQNEHLISFANMMRVATESICLKVAELGSKCVGARGLMQPYRMETIVRDLQFYLRQPSPDAALRDVAHYVIHSAQPVENLWNHDVTTV